jgi:hypothetical protein
MSSRADERPTQNNGNGHQSPEITMSRFFDELMESVKQMDEIVQGKRQLSSTHHHDREST